MARAVDPSYRLDDERFGPTLFQIIVEVGNEVDRIIKNEERGQYLYALMLCYSFAENALKYLNWNYAHWQFVNAWDSEKEQLPLAMPIEEQQTLTNNFLRKPSFERSIKQARRGALEDNRQLADDLDRLRKKRNDVVHQLWLWKHRKRPKSLLLELKDAVETCRRLVDRIAKLSEETGDVLLFTVLEPNIQEILHRLNISHRGSST